MIAAVLDRIGSFFDRTFVVSAVFPALIALFILGVTTMTVLGFESSFLWFESLSGAAKSAIMTSTTGSLLLLAFTLRALRANILSLWCGQYVARLGALGPLWGSGQRNRHAALRETARRRADVVELLRQRITPVWTPIGPEAPQATIEQLLQAIARVEANYQFSRESGHHQFRGNLLPRLVIVFKQYNGHSLVRAYTSANELAKTMDADIQIAAQTADGDLDLCFGPAGTMRPTRLGNIVEALDAYPFRRYGIEGSIFWPYLQQVMTGSVVDDMRDQRTLLDLGLTLATVFTVLSMIAWFGGPWIWWDPFFWLSVGVASLFFAWAFYLIAVQAALAMSRAMRAGCDLFRLEALHQLYRTHPATFLEERTTWQQVGRLAVYGDFTDDFALRPREPAGGPPAEANP